MRTWPSRTELDGEHLQLYLLLMSLNLEKSFLRNYFIFKLRVCVSLCECMPREYRCPRPLDALGAQDTGRCEPPNVGARNSLRSSAKVASMHL